MTTSDTDMTKMRVRVRASKMAAMPASHAQPERGRRHSERRGDDRNH